MLGEKKSIKTTSFEKLWLRISGMRVTRVYELVRDGDDVRIDEYEARYPQGKEVLELERSKNLPLEIVISKLNEVNMFAWDGFHGEHPKNVLDGDMFSFVATLNGKEIKADGSANFPKGYNEFVRFVGEILND